jgi:hypothetical protein
MTDLNAEKPLLQSQRRKLIVGASILAVASIMVLFPGYISALVGLDSLPVGLSGLLIFGVGTFWLAHWLKCPGCGINLFLYGLNHAKYGNWLEWLFKQSVCPKCGYRATGESARGADQRS